jgi:hypothetical protein
MIGTGDLKKKDKIKAEDRSSANKEALPVFRIIGCFTNFNVDYVQTEMSRHARYNVGLYGLQPK